MVSTQDSESCDPSSNLGGTWCLFQQIPNCWFRVKYILFNYLLLMRILNGFGVLVNPARYWWGSGWCPGTGSNLRFLTRVTKKMSSSDLARGSPRHILLPWPNGTKYSGLLNTPDSRNLSGLNLSECCQYWGSVMNFLMFDNTTQSLGRTWPEGRVNWKYQLIRFERNLKNYLEFYITVPQTPSNTPCS